MKEAFPTSGGIEQGGVYVYLFDELDKLDECFISENLLRLPEFRREQCARYRRAVDKKSCILAWLLLEKGLREQYGITRPGQFVYNEFGKPYLRDHPQIFFSISHCKSGVVCALADFEIGADIQDIQPFDIDIARRVCSEMEFQRVLEAEDPAVELCKVWTEKESYAKAIGVSVADTLKQDLPKHISLCREIKDCVLTVAVCHFSGYSAVLGSTSV